MNEMISLLIQTRMRRRLDHLACQASEGRRANKVGVGDFGQASVDERRDGAEERLLQVLRIYRTCYSSHALLTRLSEAPNAEKRIAEREAR